MAIVLPESMCFTEFGPYYDVSRAVSSPEPLISEPALPAELIIVWNPSSISSIFKSMNVTSMNVSNSNVTTGVSTFNTVACLIMKTKVECMQFMSVGSKLIVGNMVTTDFSGRDPFNIFISLNTQQGWKRNLYFNTFQQGSNARSTEYYFSE